MSLSVPEALTQWEASLLARGLSSGTAYQYRCIAARLIRALPSLDAIRDPEAVRAAADRTFTASASIASAVIAWGKWVSWAHGVGLEVAAWRPEGTLPPETAPIVAAARRDGLSWLTIRGLTWGQVRPGMQRCGIQASASVTVYVDTAALGALARLHGGETAQVPAEWLLVSPDGRTAATLAQMRALCSG